jgi:quinoprotein glucose dehydrogenase
MYVPSITGPVLLTVVKSSNLSQPDYDYTGTLQFGPDGPKGLPLFKPPYGRITAIDLNTGEHLWMRPVGDGPRDHPALQHLKLPQLGWPYRSFVLLTKSLLFVAQEGQVTGVRGISPRGNAIDLETKIVDPALLALDPKDGHLLAKIALPANATGTPLTYRARGRQYIVIPIGGASQPAELVALAIK